MSKAQKINVVGIGEHANAPWVGEYKMVYNTMNSNTDHWMHKQTKNYFIYRNSYYWFISNSDFKFKPSNIIAKKEYTYGHAPVGDYDDASGIHVATIDWIDFP